MLAALQLLNPQSPKPSARLGALLRPSPEDFKLASRAKAPSYLSRCMYIYIYTCIYIYMYVYVCVRMYVCMHGNV